MKRKNVCKRLMGIALSVMLVILCTACGRNTKGQYPQTASQGVQESMQIKDEADSSEKEEGSQNRSTATTEEESKMQQTELTIKIGNQTMVVAWEENESIVALKKLVSERPLTVQMSMYGGYEQVGSLGSNLPRNDVQTKTEAGDIVLYSGNNIVVFYGSNSWAYTRLGKITDLTEIELASLLGNGDVTITLSME